MSGFLKRAALTGLALAALVVGGFFAFNGVMGWLLHFSGEIAVPPVVGKSTAEALAILSRAGLTLTQEGVEYDESMPAGSILRQRPTPGMVVRKGRAIRVVVSKGGESLFVPDVTGKVVSDAQTLISGAGLSLGEISQGYSTVYSRGLVVAQVPKAGEVASKGSLVDLKVSQGGPPDNIKLVPDLRKKSLDEAQAWSRRENVSLVVRESTTSAAAPGTVIEQDPMPDQVLKPGMQIELVTSPAAKTEGNAVQIQYAVPPGPDKVQVRIVARDEAGEREVFKGERDPGETLSVPLVPSGPTRVRIYLNDVLVDERIVGQ